MSGRDPLSGTTPVTAAGVPAPPLTAKERQAIAGKKYRQSEKGKLRAKAVEKNRVRDPEKKKAYMIQWLAENKERIRAKRKEINNVLIARGYYKEYYKRFPAYHLIRAAKSRAKKMGLEFDLTREWAEASYTGMCSVTGMTIERKFGRPGATAPSLDRINPARGYTQDNCRWVIWAFNRFKGTDSDEDIFAIARAITTHNDRKFQ